MRRADTPCRECHEPEWKCDCGIPEPTEKPARRRHWPWVGFLVGFIILEAGGFALLFWPDPVAKEPPAVAHESPAGWDIRGENLRPGATANRTGGDVTLNGGAGSLTRNADDVVITGGWAHTDRDGGFIAGSESFAHTTGGVLAFETAPPEKMIFDIPVVFGEDVVFEQEVTFKKGFSQPAQD